MFPDFSEKLGRDKNSNDKTGIRVASSPYNPNSLMYGSWPQSSSLASFSKRTFIMARQSLQGTRRAAGARKGTRWASSQHSGGARSGAVSPGADESAVPRRDRGTGWAAPSPRGLRCHGDSQRAATRPQAGDQGLPKPSGLQLERAHAQTARPGEGGPRWIEPLSEGERERW